MGYANDEEAGRLSNGELDETLPLYEDTEAGPATDLTPPEPKATPDEVRDFIVGAMRSRGIGLDHARRVASKWTLGTGRELRQYPASMFRDLFGAEDGWVVYKEVRVRYYTHEAAKGPNQRVVCSVISGFAFLICLIGAILIGTVDKHNSAGATMVGAIFLIFGGMIAIGFGIGALAGSPKPEDRAENELKSQWNTNTPAQPGQGR